MQEVADKQKRRQLSLSSKVCEPLVREIIAMIQRGELRPGQQLPPQETLAEELGVSRTSLREALKELAYRGLVHSRHGVGTFVSSSFATQLEVLEARKYIETGAAFLAAVRASAEGAERLKELARSMEAEIVRHDPEAFSALDFEFHLLVAELSGNLVFGRMLRTMQDLVLKQHHSAQILPGAIERAHRFHQSIAEAIASRDAARAAQAMGDHLEDVARALSGNVSATEVRKRRKPQSSGVTDV